LLALVVGLAAGALIGASPCPAVSLITDADIIPTTGNEVQSGNGTLDYIFFWEGGGVGVSENAADGFDGDDANRDMPNGSQNVSVSESFVTSIGELREFYTLNFPDGMCGSTCHRMGLFVDVNQTGSGKDLYLDTLTVVLNYDAFGDDRDDPATYDVSSELQESTGSGFSGGTILAQLDAFTPKYIGVNEQGAGWADYIIDLGIDPFDSGFSDSDRILFFWESHGHNDGGETIYLSGSYCIPEPATMALVGFGALLLLVRRKRR